MKSTGKLAALSAGTLLIGLFGELYRHVFVRGGSPLLSPLLDSKNHAADYYVHRDSAAEALRKRRREDYAILSSRGLSLRGYYYPGAGEGKRIAFLIHGYRSEQAETAGMFYEFYRSRGFDLFCCDHAAHGQSEGKLIGFAAVEEEDCLRWVNFLRRRFGSDVEILLHGFSMGAATVLRMAPRCPENVILVVEDSGYRSAEIQLRRQLGPLYPPLALLHRLLGIDLRKAAVLPDLQEASMPLLFVHGQSDPSVPFENGPLLYDAFPGKKDCLFLPGLRHIETFHAAPETYGEKLDALLAGRSPI